MLHISLNSSLSSLATTFACDFIVPPLKGVKSKSPFLDYEFGHVDFFLSRMRRLGGVPDLRTRIYVFPLATLHTYRHNPKRMLSQFTGARERTDISWSTTKPSYLQDALSPVNSHTRGNSKSCMLGGALLYCIFVVITNNQCLGWGNTGSN